MAGKAGEMHFSRPTNVRARFPLKPSPAALPPGAFHYTRYVLWRGTGNSELIIYAHGCRTLGSEVFVPKGPTLHFFGPDFGNLFIADPNLNHMIGNGLLTKPYEAVFPGQRCADYMLVNFQRELPGGYDHVQNCLPSYDVVTIVPGFDQHWREFVQLSELLEHLNLMNHRYSKVHCIFCRGLMPQTVAEFPALQKSEVPITRV
jgi:hypothetical protein